MALGRVICLRAKSNDRDDGTVQSVCSVVQRIYAARGDGMLLSLVPSRFRHPRCFERDLHGACRFGADVRYDTGGFRAFP